MKQTETDEDVGPRQSDQETKLVAFWELQNTTYCMNSNKDLVQVGDDDIIEIFL